MSTEGPIPATEGSIFVRRTSYDEDDTNRLDPATGEPDTEVVAANDSMEANVREEGPPQQSRFKNLTGASPRVHPRRGSRDATASASATPLKQALQTSSSSSSASATITAATAVASTDDTSGAAHLSNTGSKQASDSQQPLQNGVESHPSPAEPEADQPSSRQQQQQQASTNSWPDQEAYDRALLATGAIDTDEEVELHAHGHGIPAAVGEVLSDEDQHLDFEDRGVDLDLDIDSDEEYSGSDEDSSEDDDDYGRILQRPCDVRKTAPLGADVTSPKFDGRTSQEFLNAVSPRFAGAEVSSPRPNIRPPQAPKPERRKRSVTFNENTSVLMGNGETQMQPLVDDEDDDDEHWNTHDFGDEVDDYGLNDNDGGHLLQGQFPTIQVGDLESPRSDDDFKKHENIPIQEYIAAIENLEKRLRLAADKLDAARVEKEDLQQKLREKNDGWLDQQGVIGDLQEELDTLRDNFGKVSHLCDEATDERRSAMQELESQKQLMAVQDSTIDRLRSTMDMKSDKLRQIEAVHKEELERIRCKLMQENADLRERNRRLSKENNSLRAQLQSVIKKTRADRDAYARVRVSLAKQAQAAKLLNAQSRSARPRADWDKENPNGLPAHYSRRYRQRPPSQQQQPAPSPIWSVLVPTAIIAVGFLARTLSTS